MSEKHVLSVQTRTLIGKQVKQLRRQGLIIASISTPQGQSLSIQLTEKDFLKLLTTAGESVLVYLLLEGKEVPVLIEEIQYHPTTDGVVHVSFRQVSLKEKVTAQIPVVVEGEADIADAVVVTVKDSVEIEALPTDLPESFVVDISTLTEIGQSITLADLKFDAAKISLMLNEDQDPAAVSLVIVQGQQVEEPEETVEPSEPELVGEEKAPEGAPTQDEASN